LVLFGGVEVIKTDTAIGPPLIAPEIAVPLRKFGLALTVGDLLENWEVPWLRQAIVDIFGDSRRAAETVEFLRIAARSTPRSPSLESWDLVVASREP